MRKDILLLSLVGSFFVTCAAADEFIDASKEFVRGNYIKAEELIAGYLGKNPGDQKARTLYTKITIKLTEEALDSGDEESARIYSEKAYRISPDDTKVQNLYLAVKNVKKAVVENRDLEKKELNLENAQMRIPKMETSGAKNVVTKIEYRTETKYKTMETVRETTRIPGWVWLSLLINIIVILISLFFYRLRKGHNRDIYSNYIRSKLVLANIMKKESEAIKEQLGEKKCQELFRILSTEKIPQNLNIRFVDTNRAFTDMNPAPRLIADIIEISEKLISDQKEAVNFLSQFLNHPNNRIKANAAKALYKYKPMHAMKILAGMVKSDDRWERLSAAWALSKIKSQEAVKLLQQLAGDGDIGVSNSVKQKLTDIINERKINNKETKVL
ncbi:MAG: HEAT repeat domain-containing protein [Planctomycetota bacterium]